MAYNRDWDKRARAVERTKNAQQALRELEEILSRALTVKNRITWGKLKDWTQFSKPKPKPPTALPTPPEPQPQDPRFQPERSLSDTLLWRRRASKIESARQAFLSAHSAWKIEATRISRQNKEVQEAFERANAE